MDKMELYHFHKNGKYDRIWKPSKVIEVSEDFKSATFKRFQNFTTAIPVDGGGALNFYDVIYAALSINQINKKELENLLKWSYKVTYAANEFKRESALENYRLANTPALPSRLHSIYLTDEKGIIAWKDKFGTTDLSLYRVEAEGNIFKTNEQLLPMETLPYKDVYDSAYNYWHPNFRKVPEDSNEYLVQGKIRVLEKIDRI